MANEDKIGEEELAVKIIAEEGITGGLGNHPKGTVLRQLSQSAFNTLTTGGFGEALEPGTAVREPVKPAKPAEPAG